MIDYQWPLRGFHGERDIPVQLETVEAFNEMYVKVRLSPASNKALWAAINSYCGMTDCECGGPGGVPELMPLPGEHPGEYLVSWFSRDDGPEFAAAIARQEAWIDEQAALFARLEAEEDKRIERLARRGLA